MNETSDVRISPREVVVLADDYDAMVRWYTDALGFRIAKTFSEGYSYTNLETGSGIRIGIAPAAEVGVTPGDRAMNTVLLQVGAPDLAALFARVGEAGGTVTFGPSFDERGGFWYGGFADPEGNPIWAVDENCP